MKLYLDTADPEVARPLLRTGLFSGVTSNPLILRKAWLGQPDVRDLVAQLTDAGAAQVFVQTTRDTAEGMVAEGQEIAALGEHLVTKIPATMDGLAATRRLADQGLPVLVTAVYHARQAILARAAGAWGIAPYVGRMTDADRDGLAQVAAMKQMLEGSPVRILAASIRSVDVVADLARLGIDSVTMAPPVAEELCRDELTDRAVVEFAAATAG